MTRGMQLCIYHRSDLDGIGSAAVIRRVKPGIQICGWNYSEPRPVPLEHLLNEEKRHPGSCSLILVDLSFNPEEMLLLKECLGDRFLWLDHHKTAIENSVKHGYDDLAGSRGTGLAAIQHAHLFFTDILWEQSLTEGVQLLGDYDSWKNEDAEYWENKVLPYQWGMRFLAKGSVDECLRQLLCPVSEVMSIGATIYSYEKDIASMFMKSRAFSIQFEGLKFLCFNGSGNSNTFNSRFNTTLWDACMIFGFNGKTRNWVVSMYTTREDLDLTPIAVKYGGGGHAKACGFSTNDIRLITDVIVTDPDSK